MEVKIYKSKQEVAQHFSEYLKRLIQKGESIHIALSGGSTPKIVFDYLADNFKDLDWSQVHFYWGDERCVPPTDDESNYRMTDEHLFSKISVPSTNIHRIKGEKNPSEEAVSYGELLNSTIPRSEDLPQFDLVILGMGDDGHTASIFPHEIHLWDAPNNCEVAVHPDSGQRRITLTGKVINNAKEVAFLVTGSSKSEKIREIMKSEGDYKTYPASLVAPNTGRLLWFLDEDAAAGIATAQS
ncbi:6-phosphogluconolactonase [Spongiimicrobium sp. 3-5]|uniref:6-phosphogluconolactonase n=1 Tax=Spongiimicrobium sp. 3-5 TaxID=3332596 RepID=UPI00397F2E02